MNYLRFAFGMSVCFTMLSATPYESKFQREQDARGKERFHYIPKHNNSLEPVEGSNGLKLYGEVVSWYTFTDDEPVYIEKNVSDSYMPAEYIKHKPQFPLDQGCRLGLDYMEEKGSWGLSSEVLYIESKLKKGYSARDGYVMIIPAAYDLESILNPSGHPTADYVYTRYYQKLISLDGSVTRRFAPAHNFIITPGVGVKALWFYHSRSYKYNGGDVPSNTLYSIHPKQRFPAAGPMIHLNTQWELGYGLGWYNKLQTAIVFGYETADHIESLNAVQHVNYRSYFFKTVPMLAVESGFRYQFEFKDANQALGIKLGIDGQYYFNEIIRNNQPTTIGYGAGVGFLGFHGGLYLLF
jgi:hypothetical protein